MPRSIPSGLTRAAVLQALSDLDSGIAHRFGQPTKYVLVHEHKRYAPKAVIGLAFRSLMGRILESEEFSGGEAPGQANFELRRLGFRVVDKNEEQEAPVETQPWTEHELRQLVADYFDLLGEELLSESRGTKAKGLPVRSIAGHSLPSIAYKYQNVSGVLVERGLPYLDSYRPRVIELDVLANFVESYLDEHGELLQQMAGSPRLKPLPMLGRKPSTASSIVESPPERLIYPQSSSKPWVTRQARRIDFAERDARNRKLGRVGERFVYEFEKARLKRAGRDDLASRVTWASQELGDGLGFDILSFDERDETERLVEVKSTGLGKFFPFYVTSNELRCSEDVPLQYQLYRVFDLSRSPHLYILHGSLSQLCHLEPILFRATI